MNICELVVSNSVGAEITRVEVTRDPLHGFINLLYNQSDDVLSTLQTLDVGDTIRIEKRWLEND
jgi:hypothetical protein